MDRIFRSGAGFLMFIFFIMGMNACQAPQVKQKEIAEATKEKEMNVEEAADGKANSRKIENKKSSSEEADDEKATNTILSDMQTMTIQGLNESYFSLPDIQSDKIKEKEMTAEQAEREERLFADTPIYRELMKNPELMAIAADENGSYIAALKEGMGDGSFSIIRYDQTGKEISKRGYGDKGYAWIYDIWYHKDMGIVLSGVQSGGGVFTQGIEESDFLACIDAETLEFRWTRTTPYLVAQCFVTDEAVLIVEEMPGGKARVVRLARDGQEIWQAGALQQSVSGIAELADGRTLVFERAVGEKGSDNKGILYCFNGSGKELAKLELDYFGKITPTDDGGFILTAFRSIKAVPQPLAVSSIWFDRETVAAKYNKDLELEWRKTYDSFKDTIGNDIVIPQRDGSLIITRRSTPY